MSGSLSNLWERLKSLRGRARLDAELREEIEGHIALRRDALVASGLAPEEAERQARLRFGSASLAREDARAVWGFPALESVAQDIGYGVRVLRRAPLFTTAAVLSLTVAIGAATTVFTLADALLFRKLPVRDPDSLRVLRWTSGPRTPFGSLEGTGSRDENGMRSTSFSEVAWQGMREAAAGRAELFGFANLYRVNATVDGRAERTGGQVVSGNYYATLGLAPALGRLLDAGDDRPEAAPAVVLSHAYWLDRFGGDAAALGRLVVVNGVAFPIVGVAPRGFHGTLQVDDRPELTFPLAQFRTLTHNDDAASPTYWHVLTMARLREGQTAEALQPRLQTVLTRTTADSKPELAAADLPRLELLPGSRGQLERRGRTRPAFASMGTIVALLLLVGCANVASLQLARGEARGHEIATRLAIGASRRRVVRQLLTEGLLLSCGAATLGLLVARFATAGLLPALGEGEALVVDLPIGPASFLFAALTAALCAVSFALTPALRLTRSGPGLDARAGRATGRRPLGSALVVAQVALTLVLVATAGLLVASARNLEAVDPGFDVTRLLLVELDPSDHEGGPERGALYASILDAAAALPGVEAATLTSHRLLSQSATIGTTVAAGAPVPAPDSPDVAAFAAAHETHVLAIGDDFFRAYGLRLLRGRAFGRLDAKDAPSVAVVNRRLARQLFGTENVLGRRLVDPEDPKHPYEVVGLVGDARYGYLRDAAPATLYVSARQQPPQRAVLAVKTLGDPLDSVSAVRAALGRVQPTLAVSGFGSQAQQARDSLRQERLFAHLASLLGAATLLLCATGLFGLLGYNVARRTREIGVRMALGARRAGVAWLVVRQSLWLVAVGIGLGAPASVAAGRVVESMLFGLAPDDVRILALAVTLMLLVGLLAAFLPARRAASVDPLIALRAE
jgi:predicted permease